jgi:hypothetical protein
MIAEMVADGSVTCYNFSDLQKMIHALLYPTIFDVYTPSSYEQSHVEYKSILERKEHGRHLPSTERESIYDQAKALLNLLTDPIEALGMLYLEA